MAVDDEFDLVFVLGDKVSDPARLRLREGLLTGPEVAAQLCPIFHILGLPVHSIVPVQVRAGVLGAALAEVLWVGVLPLIYYLMLLLPVNFD